MLGVKMQKSDSIGFSVVCHVIIELMGILSCILGVDRM